MTSNDKSTLQALVDAYSMSAIINELWAMLSKQGPAIHAPSEITERFNDVLNAVGSSVDALQEIGR